jgi:hypothetical protein
MNIKLLFFLAITSGILISKSRSQSGSKCPKSTPIKNFRPAGISAQWFLTHKIVNIETKYKVDPELFNAFNGSCTTIKFSYSESAKTFNLTLSTVSEKGKTIASSRTAKLNPNGSFTQKVKILTSKISLLIIKYFIKIINYKQFNIGEGTLSYTTLDSDYENFGALYLCSTFTGTGRIQLGWIVSRKRTIDQIYIDKALKAYKDQNLLTGIKLESVPQTRCNV